MQKFILAPMLMTVGLASPVFAQDADELTVYGGPIIGYDHIRYKGAVVRGKEDGIAYGGLLGVQVPIAENVVSGLEGEITDTDIKTTTSPVFLTNDTLSATAKRDLYVGGRMGYHVAPSTLIYIKGGYSNLRIKADYSDGITPVSAADNLDGYRIGGGIEVRFGALRVLAEYRYSDYSSFKYQGISTGIDAKRQQAMLSVLMGF